MGKQNEQLDEKKLREAVKQAVRQPRLAFYSPVAAAILNYRKSVIPRYSISDEIAKIVESALRQKYPKLTAKAKKAFQQARREASAKQPGKAVQ
ncbi:MAG: hypothetical protein QW614_00250 [Candidatus Caldarchaeum sp.]|uniref:Uncharacterized protein n=1 Tax=Caldiarchaeum subterraneum TaxID=311458 RepID=A0A7C5L7C6_CALS0